jgi:S1-C subfamily serine protease
MEATIFRPLRAVFLLLPVCAGGCILFLPQSNRSPRLQENWRASYKVQVGFAHGSGVVLTEDGYILTAAHVAKSDPVIEVAVQIGPRQWQTRRARLVAVDDGCDLAVIKAEGEFDRHVVLAGPNDIQPGDLIYAIGYPYDTEESVGRGYVIKTGVSFEMRPSGQKVKNALLLDLFAGPGASGEGIFAESDGRLVGLLSGYLPLTDSKEPPYLARWGAAIGSIRYFLDLHGIPYYR